MNTYKCSDNNMRCIWKLLASRRMFADHLEMAEMCIKLNICTAKSPEPVLTIKTLGAGCILTVAAATRWWFSQGLNRWELAASTTSAVVLGAMAYGRYCYHDNLSKITKILAAVDAYDGAMRKMLLCINEMVYGNDRIGFLRGRDVQKNLFSLCVENSTKIIYEFYNYVKVLEGKIKFHDELANLYDPMESLDSCEVFRKKRHDQSTIKQLYNIFIYMQSHCLMLLTLGIACDLKLAEVKTETKSLIACLNRLTGELKKQYAMISASQDDTANYQIVHSRTISKDMLSVKQQSLELAAKLSVNIQHIVRLDQTIQSIESADTWQDRVKLEEAVNNLDNCQSYFKIRLDEFDRLIITIKKLLHATKPQLSVPEGQSAPLEVALEDAIEKLMIEQQETAPMDEFFLNTGNEPENENALGNDSVLYNLQMEDELISKRMMKKRFKPVLAQLQERLVPVKQSFRERERVALQRKGISLAGEKETDTEETASFTIDTDEEGELTEMVVKHEYRRSQRKYQADREFLASKPQFSIFCNPPTMEVHMEESYSE